MFKHLYVCTTDSNLHDFLCKMSFYIKKHIILLKMHILKL